jgi:hypothetical protein
MYDLARIRYVTEHYAEMAGLVLLPYSLWFLGWAAYDLGWIGTPSWLSNEWLFSLVTLILAASASFGIGWLYERSFGKVTRNSIRLPKPTRRDFWTWVFGGTFVMTLSELGPDLSKVGLYFVLWAVVYPILVLKIRISATWTGLGIIIGAMSLAPLLDPLVGPVYPTPLIQDVVIKLVIGTGLLLIGVANHLTLVRTLGPIRREEESHA